MMLLTAFIIPHMGSGPFWAMRMWTEADKCKKYWWTNFLAISNFIDVENQVNMLSCQLSRNRHHFGQDFSLSYSFFFSMVLKVNKRRIFIFHDPVRCILK